MMKRLLAGLLLVLFPMAAFAESHGPAGNGVGGSAEVKSAFAAANPMGRLALPDDIAQAVLWLCSDLAGYVSGQGIVLTGAAQ